MRARLKTDIWDVWQYRPGAARPLWVLNCTETVFGDRLGIRHHDHTEALTHGDWLVRDAALHEPPTIVPDADFQRDYEIMK